MGTIGVDAAAGAGADVDVVAIVRRCDSSRVRACDCNCDSDCHCSFCRVWDFCVGPEQEQRKRRDEAEKEDAARVVGYRNAGECNEGNPWIWFTETAVAGVIILLGAAAGKSRCGTRRAMSAAVITEQVPIRSGMEGSE